MHQQGSCKVSIAAYVYVSQVLLTHGLFPHTTEHVNRWWVVMVGGGGIRMRQILVKMGYTCNSHFTLVTSNDFCWVGHTAPKTKEMVKKAMGGVLLVDEVYYLYAANNRDYGQEILLNVMENNAMATAGYKDQMD